MITLRNPASARAALGAVHRAHTIGAPPRVAVIGCGGIGRAHARAYAAAGAPAVAFIDPVPEAGARAAAESGRRCQPSDSGTGLALQAQRGETHGHLPWWRSTDNDTGASDAQAQRNARADVLSVMCGKVTQALPWLDIAGDNNGWGPIVNPLIDKMFEGQVSVQDGLQQMNDLLAAGIDRGFK